MRWIAALGGALLAVALFLPWYTYDTARIVRELRESLNGANNEPIVTFVAIDGSDSSAWDTFAVIDVLLALIAVVVIAAALVPRLRLGAAVAATFGVPLVVWRIVDHPGPTAYEGISFYPSPAIGAWLALAGALVAAAGSWLAVRAARRPSAPAA